MSKKKLCRLTVPLSLVLAVFLPQGASAATIAQPECGPLVDWARTIDVKERWNPVEGNPRLWLPQALNTEAFVSLFGKPAMDWSQEDVQAARTTLIDCWPVAPRTGRFSASPTASSTAS